MASADDVLTLSIATANCTGANKFPHEPDSCRPSAPELRYELLKDVFMENDVIMLQEIKFKKSIEPYLEKSHHMLFIPRMETGILLKKNLFQEIPECFEGETEGELLFTVAKPLGWQKDILVASYHGRTSGNKTDATVKMIKVCLEEKQKKNAAYVIIGGDFNLSDEKVEKYVLPEITESKFNVSSCAIPMVHRLGILDYYIYEDGLSVTVPQIKQFPSEVLKKYKLSYKEHETLQNILDHDPVVAKTALTEDVDGAGEAAESGKGGGGGGGAGIESAGGGKSTESGGGGIESGRGRTESGGASSYTSIKASSSKVDQASSTALGNASNAISDQESSSKSDQASPSNSDKIPSSISKKSRKHKCKYCGKPFFTKFTRYTHAKLYCKSNPNKYRSSKSDQTSSSESDQASSSESDQESSSKADQASSSKSGKTRSSKSELSSK